MGQATGANLFHSFASFDVRFGERVTFESGGAIRNIFSRVTGGRPSTIDGSIASTANLFFINPSGLVFGPNATLNVPGSFHASSAHYVDFADNGRFYSSLAPGSVLSLAEPSQFGFLNQARAPISVTRSTLHAGALSFVGGDVAIESLADLSSPGPVVIRGGEVVVDLFSRVSSTGGIDFNVNSLLVGGGSSIRSGGDSGNITINARDGVVIDAYLSRSSIQAYGNDSATSRSVRISTPELIIDGGYIDTSALGTGPGPDIVVDVERFSLTRGGYLGPAPPTLDRAAISQSARAICLNCLASRRTSTARRQASAIRAGFGWTWATLRISDGANITSGPLNSNLFRVGFGGDIDINATRSIEITGNGGFTGISSSTFGSSNAGNISLRAPRITLDEVAEITAETFASGDAGRVSISTDSLTVSGDSSIESGTVIGSTGRGGSLAIDAGTTTLTDGGHISVTTRGSGAAGDITLTGGVVRLSNSGRITSNSTGTGVAGPITVHANELYLDGVLPRITTVSNATSGGDIWLDVRDWVEARPSSEISTSVFGGDGGGGNILITMGGGSDVAVLILHKASELTARAVSGPGGNMRIVTGPVPPVGGRLDRRQREFRGRCRRPDSRSMHRTPQSLVTSPRCRCVFLDAAGLIREGCSARAPEGASRLLLGQRTGLPATPGGLLPATTPDFPAVATEAPQYAAGLVGTTADGRPVLLRVTCGSPRKAG